MEEAAAKFLGAGIAVLGVIGSGSGIEEFGCCFFHC